MVYMTFMIQVENCKSSVHALNVPKKEFINVMNNIWEGDNSTFEIQRRHQNTANSAMEPKDSFIKLVRQMEKRSIISRQNQFNSNSFYNRLNKQNFKIGKLHLKQQP